MVGVYVNKTYWDSVNKKRKKQEWRALSWIYCRKCDKLHKVKMGLEK